MIKFVWMTKIKKQNKLLFYINGYSARFLPHKKLHHKISGLREKLSSEQLKTVDYRVDYYNKISETKNFIHCGTRVKDLLHPKTPKAYYFDTYDYAKYFDKNLLIDFAFGDVNTILPFPMITKSRPISGDNQNNILLNLDKARHFISVDDVIPFFEKQDLMIGRCAVYQEHRSQFYEKNFQSNLCDIGQVNRVGGRSEWIKPKISISAHLDYKFILSLEGNDVATNLKWIMSSNSIAVSPPLKMETWYMEGTLVPDQHFIGINENYDNFEEKIQYYLDHPNEAKNILENAKAYRNQFNQKNMEDLISLLVLKKYFEYFC